MAGPAPARPRAFCLSGILLDSCRKDFKTGAQVKVRVSLLKLGTVRQRQEQGLSPEGLPLPITPLGTSHQGPAEFRMEEAKHVPEASGVCGCLKKSRGWHLLSLGFYLFSIGRDCRGGPREGSQQNSRFPGVLFSMLMYHNELTGELRGHLLVSFTSIFA